MLAARMVFLAAGSGTRLLPYTSARPKCLLPIEGVPLLDRIVAVAHKCGLTDIVVVRGKKGGRAQSPSVVYMEDHDGLNMVHSLFKARDLLHGEIIISYGDIIYEPRVLRSLLNAEADVAVIVDASWEQYYQERVSDIRLIAESLVLDGSRIRSIGQPLSHDEVPEGQYIGLVKWSPRATSLACGVYDELAARFHSSAWRNSSRFGECFMTDFLQELIDRGAEVHAVPVQNGWLEFDTVDDYEALERWAASGTLDRLIQLDRVPRRPTVVSAGGVVGRRRSGQLEVLLVGDGISGHWRLPKGMQEPGEAIEDTARREVLEETGVAARIGAYIGETGWIYTYEGREWEERAHFFSMLDGVLSDQPDGEHSIVAWVPADHALEGLRYATERDILRRYLKAMGTAHDQDGTLR